MIDQAGLHVELIVGALILDIVQAITSSVQCYSNIAVKQVMCQGKGQIKTMTCLEKSSGLKGHFSGHWGLLRISLTDIPRPTYKLVDASDRKEELIRPVGKEFPSERNSGSQRTMAVIIMSAARTCK